MKGSMTFVGGCAELHFPSEESGSGRKTVRCDKESQREALPLVTVLLLCPLSSRGYALPDAEVKPSGSRHFEVRLLILRWLVASLSRCLCPHPPGSR